MKLIGQLKNKVEKAETKGEAKQIIREAGMLLDDQEMDQVIGGVGSYTSSHFSRPYEYKDDSITTDTWN